MTAWIWQNATATSANPWTWTDKLNGQFANAPDNLFGRDAQIVEARNFAHAVDPFLRWAALYWKYRKCGQPALAIDKFPRCDAGCNHIELNAFTVDPCEGGKAF